MVSRCFVNPPLFHHYPAVVISREKGGRSRREEKFEADARHGPFVWSRDGTGRKETSRGPSCTSFVRRRRRTAAARERDGRAEGRPGGWRTASVSNEFRISLADGRRDYFKEIRNYLIRREKVINSGETN